MVKDRWWKVKERQGGQGKTVESQGKAARGKERQRVVEKRRSRKEKDTRRRTGEGRGGRGGREGREEGEEGERRARRVKYVGHLDDGERRRSGMGRDLVDGHRAGVQEKDDRRLAEREHRPRERPLHARQPDLRPVVRLHLHEAVLFVVVRRRLATC